MRTISIFLFLFSGMFAAEPDISFSPVAPEAVVSFEGVTQTGKRMHRLEVRRLSYFHPDQKKSVEVFSDGGFYVIYYAGDDYGPEILGALGGIDPLVRMASPDLVEIFYLAGAHTHIRERWRLTGSSAKKESHEEIDWRDDPRMKKEPNQASQPMPLTRHG